MRYFFHISYYGRNFNGWQKHPKAYSVQAVLEEKISQVFKTPIGIIGCGRTDAQVHAIQYFFHCDLPENWDFDLIFRLNKLLPSSIVVHEIIPVHAKSHARFDAVLRSYDYFIHSPKDAFLSQISTHYEFKDLDFEEMAKALALFVRYEDFRNFCVSPDKNEHTRCKIKEVKLFVNERGTQIRFYIAGNRFLTKMIRITMWRLLQVGEGKMSLETFEKYFKDLDNQPLISFAKPEGLYLSGVFYRELKRPIASDLALFDPSLWKEVVSYSI
ncbi:MAG: tRNA pseudouridine(38-40) synthase TruA [Pedobacter sp.]|nr:MAG: tRNA pseudouridine(38-40) synthase TruA [Pedobacter sp.]